MSVRTRRTYLLDPAKPMPHFRMNGKILVSRTEFDAWMRNFRADRQISPRDIADSAMERFR